jgi:hypothetical protein
MSKWTSQQLRAAEQHPCRFVIHDLLAATGPGSDRRQDKSSPNNSAGATGELDMQTVLRKTSSRVSGLSGSIQ